MTAGVAGEGDGQDRRRQAMQWMHIVESEPAPSVEIVRDPEGVMGELSTDVTATFDRGRGMTGGDQFGSTDMNVRIRKVSYTASVVQVEVRQHDMPDIVGAVTEFDDLPGGGFGDVESRPQQCPQKRAYCRTSTSRIVGSQTCIDEDEFGPGVDEQTMSHHPYHTESRA
ncbi:hypothetical protein AWN90_20360 [Nocardia terpenica]|uniref:Uncharacterized protein n=1 Tax=Nocardia terpenica TaxID=455432 RepID=A0A164PKU3_9NOCA|nr:hypothetical protein AWN90_20360 [Nocardia terpenica]